VLRFALRVGSVLVAAALVAGPLGACGADENEGPNAPLEPESGSADTHDNGDSADGATSADSPHDAAKDASPLIAARPYAVTQPSKYDPNVPTPLVVLLHGYTYTAKVQDDYFKVSALAEKKTFLVALPEGTKDSLKNQFWNAGDACCDFYKSGVDDVAYLHAVIDDMKARFNVDPKRVYVVGHSNGGFMAHRLACDLADDIAGIVSLAGAVDSDPTKCNPSSPVSVLEVHGDADGTVAYGGGSLIAGLPPYPSARTTIATWAGKNGCDGMLTPSGEKLDLESGIPGDETTVARYACAKGAAELWTIAGGTHVPSFQPTWAERFYAFLEAHPKR
jgi:polyhydroxybutyrate depolymerase